MKRLLYFIMFLLLLVNCSPVLKTNGDDDRDILYISKTGGLWDDYINMMNIVFPGGTVSGLYYHKLYAEYNPDYSGYVIKEKVASHCSYSKKVEEGALGLCFSYNPEYESGRKFGKQNFKVWTKLRVGDVLYPHGVDFENKSIKVSGNLSGGTIETDSWFSVRYSDRNIEPTAYAGKTIVALGDSTTCNGGWTEAVSDMLGCSVVNSGVSANRTTEALKRFEEDVSQYSPDIVFIMFGINDCVQYYYSNKTLITFKNELIELQEKCKKIGAKTIFITPNNIKVDSLNYKRYEEYGGLPNCFPKFIKTIKEVADETDSYSIDIYNKFLCIDGLLCDSVHPNTKGYNLFSSTISEYMIEFADVICADFMEGYVSSGEGTFTIQSNSLYVEFCTVYKLKSYFCNEIVVYNSDGIMDDTGIITENCKICWIDEYGLERDCLLIKEYCPNNTK